MKQGRMDKEGIFMKKYVKPELFYEQYELSQHIANCEYELKAVDSNSCHAIGDADLGLDYFMLYKSEPLCNETDWEDYCYEAGANGLKIFDS